MILVGAHSRAPYNPLINRAFWAHGCAPLLGLIKIKRVVETVSAVRLYRLAAGVN